MGYLELTYKDALYFSNYLGTAENKVIIIMKQLFKKLFCKTVLNLKKTYASIASDR